MSCCRRYCIQYYKDTILKAIYNIRFFVARIISLYSVLQRYNFESNLQPLRRIPRNGRDCIQYYKDTILKAIYNFLADNHHPSELYSVLQRYNFESNLQLISICLLRLCNCIQYYKDTILKAIYNILDTLKNVALLYSVLQRYNFESNLQP